MINLLKNGILVFGCFLPLGLFAQNGMLTGNVFENRNRSVALKDVSVINLSTKNKTFTNDEGHYVISAKKGDLIAVSLAGYKTDTLYLSNLLIKNIYLILDTIALKGVAVTAVKISPYLGNLGNPDNKPPAALTEMDKKKGGIRLNLGYNKYRKNQKKTEQLSINQTYMQEIADHFNETSVKDIIKFKGSQEDFDYFMALYKPTLEEVKAQRPFNYALYIAEAYRKWEILPADKRKLKPLPKAKTNARP